MEGGLVMRYEKTKQRIDDHIKSTKGVTRSGITGNKEKAWKEIEAFRMIIELNKG